MEGTKKRGKILLRRMVVILVAIFCYFLVAAAIVLDVNRLSYRMLCRLEKVEECDAVMVVYFTQFGKEKCAAVTKAGRWKCADLTDALCENESQPREKQKEFIEIIDEMMEDEAVPYQKTKLSISENLLKKAINLKFIGLEPKNYTGCYAEWHNEWDEDVPFYAYAVVRGYGDMRRLIYIRTSDCYLYPDIDVLRMTYKLHQLEKMREAVMGKPQSSIFGG